MEAEKLPKVSGSSTPRRGTDAEDAPINKNIKFSDASPPKGRKSSLPKFLRRGNTAPVADSLSLPPVKMSGPNRNSNSAHASEFGGLGKTKCKIEADEWKNDEHISAWFKTIQKRKLDVSKKKFRQAQKDANWVLARRQQQTKDIRERQKAEEFEARLQATGAPSKFSLSAHKSSMIAKVTSAVEDVKGETEDILLSCVQSSATGGGKPGVGVHSRPTFGGLGGQMSHHEPPPKLGLPAHEGPLEWQVPPLSKQSLSTKELGVWVRPGQFTTTTIWSQNNNKKNRYNSARSISSIRSRK